LNTPSHSLALQDEDRRECFRIAFEGTQFDPSRIFQTLQRILLFIKTPPPPNSSEFYVEILAAHLGVAEKWFLYTWVECHPHFEPFFESFRESGLLRSLLSYLEGIQIRFDNSKIDQQAK
jgi:hypothetical protein